uniref:Uncharacterized protein n=1 Tax=Cucumis melo TaxID=3656 RepID=A0A9I9CXT5_CUCME
MNFSRCRRRFEKALKLVAILFLSGCSTDSSVVPTPTRRPEKVPTSSDIGNFQSCIYVPLFFTFLTVPQPDTSLFPLHWLLLRTSAAVSAIILCPKKENHEYSMCRDEVEVANEDENVDYATTRDQDNRKQEGNVDINDPYDVECEYCGALYANHSKRN